MVPDSKSIVNGLFVIGGLFIALITAVSMATSVQGGLAALTPIITASISITALVKPRAGLFCLVPLVIWIDQYKRLAVYFGGVDSMIVMQTLAMPFVILAALNIGFILNALFGRIKLDKICFVFYAIAVVIGGGVYLTMEASFAERAQRALNLSGYITLIPIAYTYLRSFEEWRKFFAMQVLFATPAALWAIKQYYFGFDEIEWTYARSGLSRVHSGQMLMFENPRVFGFFGSASALGCVAIYCTFACWHALRYKKSRLLWVTISCLLFWVLFVSTQRTILIYPFIVLVAAILFRTRARLWLGYSFAFTTFIVGIFTADYMIREGLDKINRAIESDSEWGSRVLRVSTFSDRLRGWGRLSKPESYSLFGTGTQLQSGIYGQFQLAGSDDDNHDIINKILINYGVVGLLTVLILAYFIISRLHQTPLIANDKQMRNDSAFALALALPAIGLSFVGGDNFNANPINMQTWTCFSGVFICRFQILSQRKAAAAATAASSPAPAIIDLTDLGLQK